MSSSAALLQSIVHQRTPLQTISKIRVRLVKGSLGTTKQTALKHFVERRLPVLRYHNPSLTIEVQRVPGSQGSGLELVKSSSPYQVQFQTLRDDELFASVLAFDRASTEAEAEKVAGVVKGGIGDIVVKQKEKMQSTKAPAAGAAPAAPKPTVAPAAPKA